MTTTTRIGWTMGNYLDSSDVRNIEYPEHIVTFRWELYFLVLIRTRNHEIRLSRTDSDLTI